MDEKHPKISYPADHLVGMRVPEGGSDCAKCLYVRGTDCANPHFVIWNFGNHAIPGNINAYCCDFFEIGKSQSGRIAAQMAAGRGSNG